MGTVFDLSFSACDPARASGLIEEAFDEVSRIESKISTWRSSSELSRFNANPVGHPFEPTPELQSWMERVHRFSVRTQDFFSPRLAPLVSAWGLRTGGRVLGDSELKRALAASKADALTIDGNRWVRRNPLAGIEEGGFGKGLALDLVSELLIRNGVPSFRMNFGGQVFVMGELPRAIGVSDPSDRERQVLGFEIKSGSVSTSGNSEHGLTVMKGGKKIRVGHLLDPRSGRPARFDGSVTALAATGVEAEILSKLLVLGAEKGIEWANRESKAVLFLDRDPSDAVLRARLSCAFPEVRAKEGEPARILRRCPFGTR